MSDPYRRYSSAERDPRAAIPAYLPSDGSTVASVHMQSAGDPRGTSDFLRSDIPIRPGGYGSDDLAGAGRHATPGFSGLAAGATTRGYTTLEEPGLTRRDALDMKPGTDIPNPLVKSDGASADQSNILFVDGLPSDCTRREVAHLFRPFIGFKDIRVVHKEPRRDVEKFRTFSDVLTLHFGQDKSRSGFILAVVTYRDDRFVSFPKRCSFLFKRYFSAQHCLSSLHQTGDKAHVLCFVEFNDAKCALTALEALQEYKFDAKKPDSPVLRIQFAKFPFRPSSVCDDRRHGGGPN